MYLITRIKFYTSRMREYVVSSKSDNILTPACVELLKSNSKI